MEAKTSDPNAAETLSPRLWIRLVITYLFIPALLFISSGDLGWWQAWVFAVLILAAGILSCILTERRHPGLLVERAGSDSAPVEPIHRARGGKWKGS